jgi:hypothetical protein
MPLAKPLLPDMDGDQLPKNLEISCAKKLGLREVALRLLLPSGPVERKHEAIIIHGAVELTQFLRENMVRELARRSFDFRRSKVLPLKCRKEGQYSVGLLK